LRCSPGTRRVLQRRVPRAQKRTRPPALRLLSGHSNALRLYACARAQRRHACRQARPRRATSATPTHPRAHRRSRRRAGRTLPTRRVRPMRMPCPPPPHTHTPFALRPAALHCVVLGPPRFVFHHGTLTARRRARAEHGTTCKPTERVLSRYRSGTRVRGCCGTGQGPHVRCRRAQARTCPVPRAATSARRAPCGSRPRRRAAPPRPPRARPRVRRRRSLSWRPPLPTRGAATTPPPMRGSTPTQSAPAPLPPGCCAPHSPPPVRR
jgi:hypothetical protein